MSELISADLLLAALHDQGLLVTRDQLRRWHRRGLIPRPVQRALGRGKGTETFYPRSAIPQAARTAELLLKNRSEESAGWQLWWEGFHVAENYWLSPLKKAAGTIRWGRRFARLFIHLDEERGGDQTPYDKVRRDHLRGKPLPVIIQSLTNEELPTFLRILVETAAGLPAQFSTAEDQDRSTEVTPFDKALRLIQNRTDQIDGRSIKTTGQVAQVLTAIAKAILTVPGEGEFSLNLIEQLNADRDYLADAFAAISALYAATRPIYGMSSFGLRLAAWFVESSSANVRALMLVLFSELRAQVDSRFYPADTVREMRKIAEQTASDAQALARIMAGPHFDKLRVPARMRQAF